MSSSKITKHCNQCKCETLFRLRRYKSKKQIPGYGCTVCISEQDKRSRVNNWFSYLAIKANSRRRLGSEKVTKEFLEQLWEKQGKVCAVTGENLIPTEKWWKPSVDRIDSNLPYLLNNIRIVAWIVNHCRGDLTDTEFVDMCDKVTKGKVVN